MKEAGYALSKRRKVEEANKYWEQFGNGDIFGQVVKKKSRLEVEKENALKAKMQETEKTLKTEGSKKKGLVLMLWLRTDFKLLATELSQEKLSLLWITEISYETQIPGFIDRRFI